MAFHKFGLAAFTNTPIEIYGTGEQTRDFTYVSDIIKAHILAAESSVEGEIFNIGGGNRICLSKVIPIIEEISGNKIAIQYKPTQKGDARHTYADISKARKLLSYNPKVSIREGLEKELTWIKNFRL